MPGSMQVPRRGPRRLVLIAAIALAVEGLARLVDCGIGRVGSLYDHVELASDVTS